MSYSSYFFTGVIPSGDRFVARWDGEFIGAFDTWLEANNAIKQAMRR